MRYDDNAMHDQASPVGKIMIQKWHCTSGNHAIHTYLPYRLVSGPHPQLGSPKCGKKKKVFKKEAIAFGSPMLCVCWRISAYFSILLLDAIYKQHVSRVIQQRPLDGSEPNGLVSCKGCTLSKLWKKSAALTRIYMVSIWCREMFAAIAMTS